MKRPAVFFDRDNTLIVSDGYLGNPAGVELVAGAADAVARCRHLGYATVVFSNQSGVGRGLFTEEMVHAVNARLDELLLDQNRLAVIDRHEFCPFHPEATVEAYRADSELRKPKPGMILQAAERLALDLPRSWVIGDAPRDIEAGKAAGCRTILFREPTLKLSSAAEAASAIVPDYTVDSLSAAVAIIEVETRSDPQASAEADAELDDSPEQPSAAPSAPIADLPPTDEPPPLKLIPPAAASVAPPQAPIPVVTAADLSGLVGRIESLSQVILQEIRRQHEQPHHEFSVSKLLAGIAQVLALASMFLAYLKHGGDVGVPILVGIFLQVLTISLLIMGRQR